VAFIEADPDLDLNVVDITLERAHADLLAAAPGGDETATAIASGGAGRGPVARRAMPGQAGELRIASSTS